MEVLLRCPGAALVGEHEAIVVAIEVEGTAPHDMRAALAAMTSTSREGWQVRPANG